MIEPFRLTLGVLPGFRRSGLGVGSVGDGTSEEDSVEAGVRSKTRRGRGRWMVGSSDMVS